MFHLVLKEHSASESELRRAYLDMARQVHPDKQLFDESRPVDHTASAQSWCQESHIEFHIFLGMLGLLSQERYEIILLLTFLDTVILWG